MIWFNCNNCKKDFSVYPSRAKKGEVKYCSKQCKYEHMKIRETEYRSLIKCEYCEKEFMRHHYRTKEDKQNFCSYECMGKAKEKKVEKTCEHCKKTFQLKESITKYSSSRFCSMECRKDFYSYDLEGNVIDNNRNCLECGKHFTPRRDEIRRGKGKFCSKECHYKFKTLDYDPDNLAFYSSANWNKTKRVVRKKYNYTCQCCNVVKIGLHVHHIIPRRKGGSDEEFNLIPLCESCHTTIEFKTRKILEVNPNITSEEMLKEVLTNE